MADRLVSDANGRNPVEVQVLSSAPLLKDKETAARLFRELSNWKDERCVDVFSVNKQIYEDLLKWKEMKDGC